jgi:hypothetical protein
MCVTHSEHHCTEAAVMASEIEQLPDLQGYLKARVGREADLRSPLCRYRIDSPSETAHGREESTS